MKSVLPIRTMKNFQSSLPIGINIQRGLLLVLVTLFVLMCYSFSYPPTVVYSRILISQYYPTYSTDSVSHLTRYYRTCNYRTLESNFSHDFSHKNQSSDVESNLGKIYPSVSGHRMLDLTLESKDEKESKKKKKRGKKTARNRVKTRTDRSNSHPIDNSYNKYNEFSYGNYKKKTRQHFAEENPVPLRFQNPRSNTHPIDNS